jgi:hypothetical protein
MVRHSVIEWHFPAGVDDLELRELYGVRAFFLPFNKNKAFILSSGLWNWNQFLLCNFFWF